MEILFIENRQATLLWQQAALALEAQGHTVSWMVQNHGFAPSGKRVYRIPYPQAGDLSDARLDRELDEIAATDRALIHFGVSSAHYFYYREKICELIDRLAPDVVFGESTQFHELLAIARCKSLGIPYLAPNSTRYPPGRLVFFLYDTLSPVGGCGIRPDADYVNAMLADINQRNLKPSYMEPQHHSWSATLLRRRTQLNIALSWLFGERYITPSPLRRLILDRAHRLARKKWDELAAERGELTGVDGMSNWVLYPLQLQPESNLDVFGQPWIDQCETMERAAVALAARGAKLVVKPNPKSKYEMTSRLVNAAKANPNVIVLSHRSSMAEAFRAAPLVLSVTGTVILECIFQGKPVAVLGTHALSELPGVTKLDVPDNVAAVLAQVEQDTALRAIRSEAESVLSELFAVSYDAIRWDPLARPDLFREDVIVKFQKAFIDVLRHLPLVKQKTSISP